MMEGLTEKEDHLIKGKKDKKTKKESGSLLGVGGGYNFIFGQKAAKAEQKKNYKGIKRK